GCAIVRWTSCHRSYSTITQQRAGLIMIHGSAADHNMLEMSRPAHCQGLDVASAQRAIRACCRARALGAPSCATRFEHVGEHVGDQDCRRWKNAARMGATRPLAGTVAG